MTQRVQEILQAYPNVVRENLAEFLNFGTLAGTGRMAILPIDQGIEHSGIRSFSPNPQWYNPLFHAQRTLELGFSGYAGTVGAIQFIFDANKGKLPMPTILKANNNISTSPQSIPAYSAMVADVEKALRLGCRGIGFTIYPGSARFWEQAEKIAPQIEKARQEGLVTFLWSYPRGEGLSKAGETSADIGAAYAAHIALSMLNADVAKVKFPTAHLEQTESRDLVAADLTPVDRIRLVMQNAFDGNRIVIFSGGPAKAATEFYDECRAIRDGGGFGSIVGRNVFLLSDPEADSFVKGMMDVYLGK